jgi:hypothetical protein
VRKEEDRRTDEAGGEHRDRTGQSNPSV